MNAVIRDCLRGKTVAVAVSGGADSMALLHYVVAASGRYSITPVALNVEHGIRGENSLRDSFFVKKYCEDHRIPLLAYSVDAPKKAKEEKLTVEQAARILRYECFFDAVKSGKCDAVFTAHHSSDNLESVLFNLFRGTGVKGLTGIKDYGDKIFRPLVGVNKAEIDAYVKENAVPFVTDETNLSDDYTRNFLRHNVIPEIKKVFPEAERSVLRLAETLKAEDEFLDWEAVKEITFLPDKAEIKLPLSRVLLSRAAIIALKHLGIKRDYEKVHADDVCALAEKGNGKSVDLPRGVKAVREYDKIVLYRYETHINEEIPFTCGAFTLGGVRVSVTAINADGFTAADFKDGLYGDADKIPDSAVIRFRKSGDVFKKFGGGTKSLSDFLTDKKIPRKDRDKFPVIAAGNEILCVFSVAVSDKIKIDGTTRNVVKFS